MQEDHFEEMWEAFIQNVHRDAHLKKGVEVVNLIGGVDKFKELMHNAYRGVKEYKVD